MILTDPQKYLARLHISNQRSPINNAKNWHSFEFDIRTASNIPETGLTVVNLMNDVRKLHDNGMWASVPFGPNVRYASRTLINYESLLSFSKYR